MSHPRRRLAIAALVALALIAILGALAWARPGGGESFSGGGGYSGGGGGGGGGGDSGDWIFVIELLVRLIYLCIVYPYIGLPLVGAIVIALIWGAISNRRNRDWNSGPPVRLEQSADRAPPEEEAADVRSVDPDFSWVLFDDFVYRLFATAQGARGNPAAMAALAPYLSEAARTSLLTREPAGAPVSRVIVGAQRVFATVVPPKSAGPEAHASIAVEFEANTTTAAAAAPGAAAPDPMTRGTPTAAAHTWYTVERWRYVRGVTAKTRPPRITRDFPCPNCGAPWQDKQDDKPGTPPGSQVCAYCNEVVDNGRFDWQVLSIEVAHADPRPPTVTNEVPERGNDVPTFRDPRLSGEWQKLLAGDPAMTREAFDARVELTYRTLNEAWSKNDLEPARGFCSDGIYDYLSYWVTAYASQGLRNQLDDMRITKRSLAKVVRDKWYDAVTVRLWATGKDYVVDGKGAVVRGSRARERPYSEYWTFIRSAARKGAVTTQKTCPHCGAPLAINMTGACTSCGVHVTAGEFDWVLSRIEQDDTYRG